MKTIFNFSKSRIQNIVFQLIPFVVYSLTFFIPIPNIVGKLIREGFGLETILIFLIFYSGFSVQRNKYWVPKALVFLFFGVSLSTLYTNPLSEWQVISGSIFFSDASRYFSDVLRILNGIPYSSFSARHPFGTMFLTSIMWITNENLKLSFIFITGIASLVTWMAIYEVWKRCGRIPATTFLFLLFLFYRRFSGLPDSENLGYIFGCLSLVLFLKSFDLEKKWLFWTGFLVLLFGMATRPGAITIILLILVWYLCQRIQNKSKIIVGPIIGTLSILFVLLLNLLSNRLIGESNSRLFSNFAYTFYGIVNGGKGWEWFQKSHPSAINKTEVDNEKNAFSEGLSTFINDPKLTGIGILNSYKDFFSLKPISVFGFLGTDLYLDPTLGNVRINKVIGITIRIIAMTLCLFGLYFLFNKRKYIFYSFLLFIYIGVVLSIPFVPPIDSGLMRVYIVTMPYIFLLPVIGIQSLYKKSYDKNVSNEEFEILGSISLSVFLITLIISSILIYKFNNPVIISKSINCPHSDQISVIISFNKGSYINLFGDDQLSKSTLNKTKYSEYRKSYEFIPIKQLIAPLNSLQPGSIIFNSIDLLTGKQIWISIPNSVEKMNEKYLLVCGSINKGFEKIGFGFINIDFVKIIK